MKAHADGIDVLRRGDADPRCVLGVTVAKAQAQVAAPALSGHPKRCRCLA
jgi:hypothetical protein